MFGDYPLGFGAGTRGLGGREFRGGPSVLIPPWDLGTLHFIVLFVTISEINI